MSFKTVEWQSGKQNFSNHFLSYDQISNKIVYQCSLKDVTIYHHNIVDIFMYHIENRQGICELLYSGGLDSELVLKFFISQKIPFKAITLRLIKHDTPINTHDLYYSEKFCRQNNIKQTFLDLDVDKFYNNYGYINYLDPYKINKFHVATHYWMIDQCDNFPIMGGEYPWPWENKPIISPLRHSYHCYDHYMQSHNITGIGNMLGHSLDSIVFFITHHLQHARNYDKSKLLPSFKEKMYSSIGLGNFEIRQRSFGWETIPNYIFDQIMHTDLLTKIYPEPHYSISWESKIAQIIDSTENYNDIF